MKKINLKSRHHKRTNKKFVIIFFLFLICIVVLLIFISKKLNPFFLDYTKTRVERFTTFIINDAIDEKVNNLLNKESLFLINQNKEGNIADISFNTVTVNELLKTITNNILKGIKSFEEGTYDNPNRSKSLMYDSFTIKDDGLVCEIPLGLITGSSLLMNLLPSIPIKISFVGYMNSYIKTKVSSYGINDVLMEIIVHVEVSQKMLLPTYADNVVIYQDIPIGYKMIKGQIPNYYFESGFSKDSNVLENKLLK